MTFFQTSQSRLWFFLQKSLCIKLQMEEGGGKRGKKCVCAVCEVYFGRTTIREYRTRGSLWCASYFAITSWRWWRWKLILKRMNVSWKAYKMTSRNGSAKYLQYTTRLDKLIQFLQRDTVFMKLGTSSTDKILLLQKVCYLS